MPFEWTGRDGVAYSVDTVRTKHLLAIHRLFREFRRDLVERFETEPRLHTNEKAINRLEFLNRAVEALSTEIVHREVEPLELRTKEEAIELRRQYEERIKQRQEEEQRFQQEAAERRRLQREAFQQAQEERRRELEREQAYRNPPLGPDTTIDEPIPVRRPAFIYNTIVETNAEEIGLQQRIRLAREQLERLEAQKAKAKAEIKELKKPAQQATHFGKDRHKRSIVLPTNDYED